MSQILPRFPHLTKNFASHCQSWRDSRQDRTVIFATVTLLLSENLEEIRGRIPARYWPPGLLLPGENHGENHGRIVPRFWPAGILLLGENLGEIRGRIPARFWPTGIFASRRESWRVSRQDPGEILAAGNFASRRESCRDLGEIPAGKKNPGGIPAEIAAGSRQDPGPYFTRVSTGENFKGN